jgi:heavy metal translocating P-type ATPase
LFPTVLLISGGSLAFLAARAVGPSFHKARLRERLQVAGHRDGRVSSDSRIARPEQRRFGLGGFGLGLCTPMAPKGAEISTEQSDFASVEQWSGPYFVASSVALPLAVAGFWFPILKIPSIAILAVSTLPIIERSYKGLVQQKRVKMEVINALTLPLMIVSGYLPAAAFGYWAYFLGMVLLARAKQRSAREVTGLIADTMRSVWIERDGLEIEVGFAELRVGDTVVVQGGGVIPVDGKVVRGMASVDQHMLTGEAQPAEKAVGEDVLAFTTVLAGKLWIRAEKTGVQTVALQIDQVLKQTDVFGAALESRVEAAADCFALPTLALGALALPVAGYTSALVVLDSAIIDNLYISGNLGAITHLSAASKDMILIKDARAIERLSAVDMVVFDKTGTLTEEQPRVAEIHRVAEDHSASSVLYHAAIAEHKQSHPIALAICRASAAEGLELPTIDDAHYEIGYGVRVNVDDRVIRVGSRRFMASEDIPIDQGLLSLEAAAHAKGHTFVYVAVGHRIIGIIELSPALRPEATEIVRALHERGLSTCILSGDHEAPTRALASELGIDRYFAETLPGDKAARVAALQQEGRTVCFIGDGMNDAIALRQADVSVSLSGASSLARDAAQVILLDGNLTKLVALFQRAERLEKTFKSSVLWDVIPNVACILGAFFFHLGVYGALIIYTTGLAGGVVNGALPSLDRRNSTDDGQPGTGDQVDAY